MALTGRTALLAALGALVVGLALPGWTGLLAVQLLLLLAVGFDLARAAPVRGLHLARDGDTSVRLGEPARVHLTLANPSGRELRAVLRDAWPPSSWRPGTAFAGSRHTVRVPAGERRRLTTVLHPTRRGDRRADRITVRSLGPLGLAGRQGSHRVPWTVRVLPAFTSRRHLPAKLSRLRELDGRTSVLTRGEGTEFDSLREYVPGDDTRSIDWRATARQSAVAVRTWRPERDRRILLVLDTGRTSAGRVGSAAPDGTEGADRGDRSAHRSARGADEDGVPRLDAAMDAALLLAALAARAGDRVDLLAYDRRVQASVQGRSAGDLLPALVGAMAPLEPALVESDARGLAATALRTAARRSLIVLFTGLDAAPVDQGLLRVLPQLTQRHPVLVASVADPRIEQMAARRGTLDGVYTAAAAARIRAERAQTADRLRRHGVTVVDATPTELAPALADAYLALKAAGRL